ncbi:MAG: DegT/DnrJ/EryC1/StrS family aminotransferase [Deltaproteobacteria bacterium]|nr:DegT/DnrJ/EryC1/StrS family aminotransferase [Deltaproteobacteria bacterium]
MVDLKGQYKEIKGEIDAALAGVFDSALFILGPNVRALEEEVADYCGVKHAVGVASGTDALHLAVRALGIGPGDEVITTPFTFIATAESIAYVGAVPVYVDIEPHTFNIDVKQIEAAITDKTKAIMPVHLFGQPANMNAIMEIAKKHGLKVIEDCAQSFGADYKGKMTGSIGEAGCFSFFPSKNLGCYGDGGMITTNSDELAQEIKTLRNHGSKVRYYHHEIGYNSRLDEFQAAILRVKLKRINDYNDGRRRAAHHYNSRLEPLGLTVPHEDGRGKHVFHQYTLLSHRRDDIHKALTEAKIASAIYYPVPLHQQEVFKDVCEGISLPVTEDVAKRCLSLPMYPELGEAEVEQIADLIKEALT